MGTACGWKKRVIQTNITYAKQTVTHIFSVSPQSHSPFSALLKTFCLTFGTYLNTQKYRLYNKKSYWDGIKEGRVQKEDFNFLFKLFHLLYMKNYKNGLPPPLEKANLSGGWSLLGKGVTPKNICKKKWGGGLCFQDTQANWGTQFDSCFFLCKATRLTGNYMEAFPSFHFWSTNKRCAFLLLIRNDTIYFCNHWVSKQQRQMAFFTPDRKPCALLESAYFFLAYSYLVRGLKMSEGDLCQNKKRSLFYSLGVSFGSHSNYIPQLSFEFLMD